MTFMDSIACEFLNQFNSAQIIIENCYLKNHNSIFIKDQVGFKKKKKLTFLKFNSCVFYTGNYNFSKYGII
jgi:hypothetical protein